MDMNVYYQQNNTIKKPLKKTNMGNQVTVVLIFLFSIIKLNTITEPHYIIWTDYQGEITNIECKSSKFCRFYYNQTFKQLNN